MLKNIPINELEVGMYVDSITEQNGNLKIKNSGRVTSLAFISELKTQGILTILINLNEQQVSGSAQALITPSAARTTSNFEDEISRARKLHHKGKDIQRKMLQAISNDLPVDLALCKAFIRELISSIGRNPDALLCMTKIREKENYLLEHSLNVAILLANFANHLHMAEQEVQELALSGFLHDIGKIKVPKDILNKAGSLSEQEMVVMRDHVYFGLRILQDMALPDHLIKIVAEHHERLDGYGYPDGARGDEISIHGRMIAIVDSYDAITADRCYKAAIASQKALKILHAQAPQKYDKNLIEQFVKSIGIYPVGSLVKLSSEKIAMVIKIQDSHPLKPMVKVFYSVRSTHYLPPVELDLQTSQYRIEKAVLASEFTLDFNRYFNEYIAL
ncbi:MAG: putative nucleotidyltransferase with HDIG domain [Paraglaciecola sp.]